MALLGEPRDAARMVCILLILSASSASNYSHLTEGPR